MQQETLVTIARKRAQILEEIRAFFKAEDFIEVDTPVVLTAPAPEPHIEAAEVKLDLPKGQTTRYLQTSPELPMKRLLAAGLEKIFQIAPVFRQGDFSPTHRPEFRMLEWYRRSAGWETLLGDCEMLLRACAREILGSTTISFGNHPIDLSMDFRRITMNEAFIEHAGFAILDHLEPLSLQSKLDELKIHRHPSDTWDDLFHRVFLERVEPALLVDPSPLFLTHYPAPLAALARRLPTDSRVSERFELYIAGIELANGFGELTCPIEQRSRFEADRDWRVSQGMHDYPMDERFFEALEKLPPSAGIALGVDRLMMLLLDAQNIKEISIIPWEHA
ncbi:MAG: EF-P lysine aminoacylase GenX [Deltaproteobacteria bacterium]|nr:EF-P lysine aminoacylase GenX [Deltaproteobacteria bacterium]MBT6491064.1 EF-P lysine aminoacylase GenX [Deltaproteobacteria bacterium]